MFLKKKTSGVFALSLALSTLIGGGGVAHAEGMNLDDIYPSDTETEDSWEWGELLRCDDILGGDFKNKLKELGYVNNYVSNNPTTGTSDGDSSYEYPTEEELNNLEESSWDAPGDYTYLVEKYPENERPRLMKVKGKDRYFITINGNLDNRDTYIDKKYFFRLFEPEKYLPKEMVEWKEDPSNGEKYNSKIYNGFVNRWGAEKNNIESYFPYGEDLTRGKLRPELTPEKGLSPSERLDFFMKHDDVFSLDTSRYNRISQGGDLLPTRYYSEDPETGKTRIGHDTYEFASCIPSVTVKPDYVTPFRESGDGAWDVYPENYFPPVDNGLTLRKTGKDNKLLAGSSWKIKNLGTGEEFTVTDNKKPGDNDKNTLEDLYEEDGLINVDLPEGRYELVESKAPKGYKLDNTIRKFIIHDRSGASFGMGAITNDPEEPSTSTTPSTPDTTPSTSTSTTPSEDISTITPSASTSTTPSTSTSTAPNTSTFATPSEDISTTTPSTSTEEQTPSFAATTTPVSPVENNDGTSSIPSSTSTPYQPQKISGETLSNDSKVGPKVNTGGRINLSFWDKVKGIFS